MRLETFSLGSHFHPDQMLKEAAGKLFQESKPVEIFKTAEVFKEPLKETLIRHLRPNLRPIRLQTKAISSWDRLIRKSVPALKAVFHMVKTDSKIQGLLFGFGLLAMVYLSQGTKMRNVAIEVEANPDKLKEIDFTMSNQTTIKVVVEPNKIPEITIHRASNQEPTVYHISIVSPEAKNKEGVVTVFDLGNNQVVHLNDQR